MSGPVASMSSPDQRIFCIGLHKTGTTSLLQAFLRLGIRTCDGLADRVERDAFPALVNRISMVETHYSDYVAFEDVPWSALWRELYLKYPNARYILTTRNREAWLQSVLCHFGTTHDAVHGWMYGSPCPQGSEKEWLRHFDAHNHAVQEFFASRPSARFLHIVIDDGTSTAEVSMRLRLFLGFAPGPCVWVRANALAERRSIKSAVFRFARFVKYLVFGKRSIRILGFPLSKDYTDLM